MLSSWYDNDHMTAPSIQASISSLFVKFNALSGQGAQTSHQASISSLFVKIHLLKMKRLAKMPSRILR
jgi:hypothetical protein